MASSAGTDLMGMKLGDIIRKYGATHGKQMYGLQQTDRQMAQQAEQFGKTYTAQQQAQKIQDLLNMSNLMYESGGGESSPFKSLMDQLLGVYSLGKFDW